MAFVLLEKENEEIIQCLEEKNTIDVFFYFNNN